MSKAHEKRLQEARRLRTYDEALKFYGERKIADTGREPDEWSRAQRAAFQADMARWRSVRFNGTAEDAIIQLARKYGVLGPLNGEAFAILAVRLAAQLGEPGFERDPPRPSKRLLHAEVCTMVAAELRKGGTVEAASERVAERLAPPHAMSARSVAQRYYEQARKIRDLNEQIAPTLGDADGGLEPSDALTLEWARQAVGGRLSDQGDDLNERIAYYEALDPEDNALRLSRERISGILKSLYEKRDAPRTSNISRMARSGLKDLEQLGAAMARRRPV